MENGNSSQKLQFDVSQFGANRKNAGILIEKQRKKMNFKIIMRHESVTDI